MNVIFLKRFLKYSLTLFIVSITLLVAFFWALAEFGPWPWLSPVVQSCATSEHIFCRSITKISEQFTTIAYTFLVEFFLIMIVINHLGKSQERGIFHNWRMNFCRELFIKHCELMSRIKREPFLDRNLFEKGMHSDVYRPILQSSAPKLRAELDRMITKLNDFLLTSAMMAPEDAAGPISDYRNKVIELSKCLDTNIVIDLSFSNDDDTHANSPEHQMNGVAQAQVPPTLDFSKSLAQIATAMDLTWKKRGKSIKDPVNRYASNLGYKDGKILDENGNDVLFSDYLIDAELVVENFCNKVCYRCNPQHQSRTGTEKTL